MPRVLLACLLLALAGAAAARGHAGQPAPALTATLLDGSRFELQKQRGHVVLISFWATWCSPCRLEMPELDRLYRRYHDAGLDVLGISMDDSDDRKAVQDFTRPFAFPVALQDDADFDGLGRIWAVPLLFVVDRQGVLQVDGRPAMQAGDFPALEQQVRRLLGLDAPPAKK